MSLLLVACWVAAAALATKLDSVLSQRSWDWGCFAAALMTWPVVCCFLLLSYHKNSLGLWVR